MVRQVFLSDLVANSRIHRPWPTQRGVQAASATKKSHTVWFQAAVKNIILCSARTMQSTQNQHSHYHTTNITLMTSPMCEDDARWWISLAELVPIEFVGKSTNTAPHKKKVPKQALENPRARLVQELPSCLHWRAMLIRAICLFVFVACMVSVGCLCWKTIIRNYVFQSPSRGIKCRFHMGVQRTQPLCAWSKNPGHWQHIKIWGSNQLD